VSIGKMRSANAEEECSSSSSLRLQDMASLATQREVGWVCNQITPLPLLRLVTCMDLLQSSCDTNNRCIGRSNRRCLHVGSPRRHRRKTLLSTRLACTTGGTKGWTPCNRHPQHPHSSSSKRHSQAEALRLDCQRMALAPSCTSSHHQGTCEANRRILCQSRCHRRGWTTAAQWVLLLGVLLQEVIIHHRHHHLSRPRIQGSSSNNSSNSRQPTETGCITARRASVRGTRRMGRRPESSSRAGSRPPAMIG